MATYNPYWLTSSSTNAATQYVQTTYGIDTAAGTSSTALAVLGEREYREQQEYIRKKMEHEMMRAIMDGRDRVEMYDHERMMKITYPIKQYRNRFVMPDEWKEDSRPLPPLPKPQPLVRLTGESLLTSLDRAFSKWVGYDSLMDRLRRAHRDWTKESRQCLGLSTTRA